MNSQELQCQVSGNFLPVIPLGLARPPSGSKSSFKASPNILAHPDNPLLLSSQSSAFGFILVRSAVFQTFSL